VVITDKLIRTLHFFHLLHVYILSFNTRPVFVILTTQTPKFWL